MPFDFPTKGDDIFEHVGFKIYSSPTLTLMFLPYWFVVLLSGCLAMASRIRWPLRFSLRGLFVVTTFLAVVLGMFAWLDGEWIGR
jgi:hypothetical protein